MAALQSDGQGLSRASEDIASDLTPQPMTHREESKSTPVSRPHSVVDSAYQTIVDGASIAPSTSIRQSVRPPAISCPIPGSHLLYFKIPVSKAIVKHCNGIYSAIEMKLKETLLASGWDPSYSDHMSLRLKTIGSSEEMACPHLVVSRAPDIEELMKFVFQLPEVIRLLSTHRTNGHPLGHIIIPYPPRYTNARSETGVFFRNSASCFEETYCGAEIILRNGLEGQAKQEFRATFGGMLEVSYEKGGVKYYGMTVGHAIRLSQLGLVTNTMVAPSMPPTHSAGVSSFTSTPSASFMGQALNPEDLPGVKAGRSIPSHDWALFEVSSPRPNLAAPPQGAATGEKSDFHPILVPEKPHILDDISPPVFLLGASGSSRYGELSEAPARLWIAQTEGFIDVYMLELSEFSGINQGDSGAWVVHGSNSELCGHVVAVDVFGNAFVVPALDTLANIRACLGAASVVIPSDERFMNATCDAKTSIPYPFSEQRRGKEVASITSLLESLPANDSRHSTKNAFTHLAKRWPDIFNYKRPIFNCSHSLSERYMLPDRIPLQILLGNASGCSTDVSRELLRSTLAKLELGKAENLIHDRARLEIRRHNSGTDNMNTRNDRLDAKQLEQALRGWVNDTTEIRDVIHIDNPDTNYILALAETVDFGQFDSLWDVLWKHMFCSTSLRVYCLSRGGCSFRLEFHTLFQTLKLAEHDDSSSYKESGLHLQTIFLSFTGRKRNYILHKGQTTIAVCGEANSRWVAYSFSSGYPLDDACVEDDMMEFTSTCLIPFAKQILDPRAYFLSVLQVRIQGILQEHEGTVRMLEAECRAISLFNEHINLSETTSRIDKMYQMMETLIASLNDAISAWKEFMKPSGDNEYLRDIDDLVSANALRSIDDDFQEFELLSKRLVRAHMVLERIRNPVSIGTGSKVILLTPPRVEFSRLHSNKNTTTLMMLYLAPFLTVTSMFSMELDTPLFGITRNLKSFFVMFLAITFILYLVLYLSIHIDPAGCKKWMGNRWKNKTLLRRSTTITNEKDRRSGSQRQYLV